ncbi:MAG: PH domain-containing protein [Bacteroidota bacterium]
MQYYITDREFVIFSGVISRKQRSIRLDRIQNISTSQNIIQKILGIVRIQAETAGESASEGVLEFVKKTNAEEIETIIRRHQRKIREEKPVAEEAPNTEEAAEEISEEKEKALFSMNLRDVAIFGVMRLRPLVLVFIGWAVSMLQQFYLIPAPEELIGREMGGKLITEAFAEWNILLLILYFLGGIIIALTLSITMDVLLTINSFYNFTLTREGDKLYTKQGLFNTRRGAIPLNKLQMLVIFTNPIRRKFGYYGLALETAGLAVKTTLQDIAIPFSTREKVESLAQRIRDFELPERLEAVSRKTIRRAMFRYSFAYIPLLALAVYFTGWGWALLIAAPILWFAAVLRWQYRGWRIERDLIFIKQGFWSQKLSVFPVEKIQTLLVRRSFFQRRLGLATLVVDTASSSPGVHSAIVDIDAETASELIESLNSRFNEKIGD